MSLKRKALDVVAADAKKPKANGSITAFFGQPKRAAGTDQDASKSSVIHKFDKEEWLSSLSDEHKDLLKLEIDTLHESWLAYLKDEIVSKDFLELKRFLKKEIETGKTVYPPMEDVYSWYAAFLWNLRVIEHFQGITTPSPTSRRDSTNLTISFRAGLVTHLSQTSK